jgi:superfamily II DNA or RNA helicase
MGYITQHLTAEVGRLAQERGREYFVRGAVKQINGDGGSVNAVVQGTMRYDVEITRLDEFIDYSCSCPYFQRDFEACKHIWAASLAAEQNGYLGEIGRSSERVLSFKVSPALQSKTVRLEPGMERDWKEQLKPLLNGGGFERTSAGARSAAERELLYVIDLDRTVEADQLAIELMQRERRQNGSWGKLRSRKVSPDEIEDLPGAADKKILAVLFGSRPEQGYSYLGYSRGLAYAGFAVPAPLREVVLPLMCSTGRCVLRCTDNSELVPLEWDGGEPWDFSLRVKGAAGGASYRVQGILKRGEAELPIVQPRLLLSGGLVITERTVARLNDHGAFGWIALLRGRAPVSVPARDGESLVAELARMARPVPVELPDELKFEEVGLQPRPRLIIKAARPDIFRPRRLLADLSFDYDGHEIPAAEPGNGIYDKERRRVIRRDRGAENAARRRLGQLGFRRSSSYTDSADAELYPQQLPEAVRNLVQEGWLVEAEGKLYRTGSALTMAVKSTVDWFEIEGSARFGETSIPLPRLLHAIKRGESVVKLDDGSFGLVPEEWLKTYGLLAGIGAADQEHVRFSRTQAGLLDALLADEPEIAIDAVFARARDELRNFSGITEAAAPSGFHGELRGYQRAGLGWLLFLQRFGFGGCLADDMGLGKTIQVLALLECRRETRRAATKKIPPSLVVVPRSLVFHWKNEAARFAPKLKILDHSGASRRKPAEHFDDYDIVITTYGTLARDAVQFKARHFDYCILDEAQAVKNSRTLSAKAVRLMRADYRLAMSGTPVENHLGELWSLFDFLNPGMLGAANVIGSAGRNPEPATRVVLARALRPFILRRTKAQVAKELPPKTEQTIYCELEGNQQKLYTELRDYYRGRLLKQGDLGNSSQFKFQVLEALLRLRQAACHPGLIDKTKTDQSSAKLDALLAQLDQVREEDHKALVFSQFTSLLAIVRCRLDSANIPYAYLDGRTRDRQARVEAFQSDPEVKLFLISLRAGGLGLNLQAAEYVYLLDPWWNPAVEAQAIDRAHRIGQTRQVFAYRLIARNTVEEKVLELQRSKRDLADAIINADNSLLHNLTREDLELLLS